MPAQPECPWVTAQKVADAAKRRCQRKRTSPVRQYNLAIVRAGRILKNADPRPGHMTTEQEQAQRDVINAFLNL